MRDPVEEFIAFNKPFAQSPRDPEWVGKKVAEMAHDAFGFFRGSYHLFARDAADGRYGPPDEGAVRLVGDVHAENFGTFKADDDRVYYDINDFDESAVGAPLLDAVRLTASAFLAAIATRPLERAVTIALACARSYATTLKALTAGGPEPEAAEGRASGSAAVDELIRKMAGRDREEFIRKLSSEPGKILLAGKMRKAEPAEAQRVRRLVADYRARAGFGDDAFWQVLDVAGRVAGVGSLGRWRYAALINAKGGKHKHVLLELKEAWPPAPGRAQAVIEAQRASRSPSNRYLGWASDGDGSFQVRQLGPHDKKADLEDLEEGSLEEVLRVQAALLARANRRAGARLDDAEAFQRRALAYGLACADQAIRDHAQFKGAAARLKDVVRGEPGA